MKRYTTLFVNDRKDFTVQTIAPDPAETQREKDLINLYPQMACQTIDGFGGAFTDAAGYVFSLMRDNSAHWRLPVWGFTAITAAVFAYFYPALRGAEINTRLAALLYRWLPTWPF